MRDRTLAWRAAWLLALAVAVVAARPLRAEIDDRLALVELKNHGIEGDTASLVQFISNGFPSGRASGSFPAQPPEKCQLLIYAMQILGKRGAQEALTPLALLARGTLSAGLQGMVQRDSLLAAADSRAVRQRQIVDFLRYNAAVALGFIGDTRARPILRELYESESNASAKCQYALSLACLGDGSGVEFLLGEVAKANQTSSVYAAKSLYYIAGVDFGYKASSPVRLRRKLGEDYARWWAETRGGFQLSPRAVIERRLSPMPEPRIAPDGVRNLIALASDRLDFSDAHGSRTAEAKLEAMGPALAKQLEPIMSDPMEDLVVRCEAMRRYVLLRGKEAKKAMKRLEKDENPEIAEYAKRAAESIDSGAALRAPVFTSEVVGGEPQAPGK